MKANPASEYPAASRKANVSGNRESRASFSRPPRKTRPRSTVRLEELSVFLSVWGYVSAFGVRPFALSIGFHDIAGATNSVDQFQRKRFVHFAAQTPHVHIDNIRVAVKIHVPNCFGNQRSRQD